MIGVQYLVLLPVSTGNPKMLVCFIAHPYSPISRQVLIVLPADKSCASLFLLA